MLYELMIMISLNGGHQVKTIIAKGLTRTECLKRSKEHTLGDKDTRELIYCIPEK